MASNHTSVTSPVHRCHTDFTIRATGETHFSLVYGVEVVLPAKLKCRSPRVRAYNEATLDEQKIDDINFVEKTRCRDVVRSARYQQGLRRYLSCHARSQKFEVGDLILHQIQVTTGRNKLSPK